MKLRTTIGLEPERYHPFNYSSKVVLLGSCFAEHIGSKLAYYKFQSCCNPFGIVFHPIAIEKQLNRVINENLFSKEDLFFINEQWHCYETHSKLSSQNSDKMLEDLNSLIADTRVHLKQASHLIITLGTAWVYRHIETDTVVGNCHKTPQKKFLKELLTVDQITESLQGSIELIRELNPKLSILISISPVRHLKDGMVQNNQSKAHLLAAVHQVVAPRKNIHYFPSYEIVLDELRDYRFYEPDMLHPNQVAIDYVWEKFCSVWLSESTKSTMQEVSAIQKGQMHKAFNTTSEEHQKFLKNLQKKMETLQERFPFMSF